MDQALATNTIVQICLFCKNFFLLLTFMKTNAVLSFIKSLFFFPRCFQLD